MLTFLKAQSIIIATLQTLSPWRQGMRSDPGQTCGTSVGMTRGTLNADAERLPADRTRSRGTTSLILTMAIVLTSASFGVQAASISQLSPILNSWWNDSDNTSSDEDMGIVLNRVLQTSTSIGLNNIVLSGSVSGYQTYPQGLAIRTGDSLGPWINVNYHIEQRDGNGDVVDWELGKGRVVKPNSSDPYIERTVVVASSNNNNKVVFGSGTKMVACGPHAEDFNGAFTLFRQDFNTSSAGSWPASDITGYTAQDFTLNETIDPSSTIAFLRELGENDHDTIMWRIIDETTVRLYAYSGASAVSTSLVFISGFAKVHHLELDFGSVPASASYSTSASLGVTLNNTSRVHGFINAHGRYINGDSRIDQVFTYGFPSDTTMQINIHTNDAGDIVLPVTVWEL